MPHNCCSCNPRNGQCDTLLDQQSGTSLHQISVEYSCHCHGRFASHCWVSFRRLSFWPLSRKGHGSKEKECKELHVNELGGFSFCSFEFCEKAMLQMLADVCRGKTQRSSVLDTVAAETIHTLLDYNVKWRVCSSRDSICARIY